jgi:hypothetical protein
MQNLLITATIEVEGEAYSLSYDLGSIDGPLTEEKFEQCYMALKPSMAKVLRDHNKIVNPWG